MWVYIYPNLWPWAGYNTNTACLSSKFSFSFTSCLITTKESSLLYYLFIKSGERINGLMTFPEALERSEIQILSLIIYDNKSQVSIAEGHLSAYFDTGRSCWASLPSKAAQFSLKQTFVTIILIWVQTLSCSEIYTVMSAKSETQHNWYFLTLVCTDIKPRASVWKGKIIWRKTFKFALRSWLLNWLEH